MCAEHREQGDGSGWLGPGRSYHLTRQRKPRRRQRPTPSASSYRRLALGSDASFVLLFRSFVCPRCARRLRGFKWPGEMLSSQHHDLNILLPGCCYCATGAGRVHVPARRGDELPRRYLRCRGPCPAPSPARLGCILVTWVCNCSQAACLLVGQVSFTEIGQHQRPFPREMMSLRKWKRVAN